jgi:uncharacterized protein (DUF1810 family)
LFCFLLGILVVALSPAVQFSAGDWGGVALLFLSSLLYLAVFILLGMFISAKSHRSSTSIIISLLCWIWLLFLMPNIASYISQSFVKTEMYDNVQFVLKDIDKEFDKEYVEKYQAFKNELGLTGMSYMNSSSSSDGVEMRLGTDRIIYEFHRVFNIWKEPTRIDYADKKWAIQKKYLDDLTYQEKLREYLSWLSPAGIFEQIADLQCHTSMTSFLRYMEHLRAYRESIIRYFKDKKLFESYSYFTPMPESAFPEKIDWNQIWEAYNRGEKYEPPEEWSPNYYPPLKLDDVPVFEYKGATVHSALNASMGRMAGLLVLCIVLLGATVLSFTKYDVR